VLTLLALLALLPRSPPKPPKNANNAKAAIREDLLETNNDMKMAKNAKSAKVTNAAPRTRETGPSSFSGVFILATSVGTLTL
jgi:hypothetical protein